MGSAVCNLLLCSLWAVSWWRAARIEYAEPSRWTAVGSCENGIITAAWWWSTVSDAGGFRFDAAGTDDALGVGARVWQSMVGF